MRSVKLKVFGFVVLEFVDDTSEGVMDMLAQIIDEPDEEPLPGFLLSQHTHGGSTGQLGTSEEHTVFSPEFNPEDFVDDEEPE